MLRLSAIPELWFGMMGDRDVPRCSIVPPYVLEALAQAEDARLAGAAHQTILLTAELPNGGCFYSNAASGISPMNDWSCTMPRMDASCRGRSCAAREVRRVRIRARMRFGTAPRWCTAMETASCLATSRVRST